jgi:probable HAF family extracellular repeat protein/parallel beta-helix repeat protein/predicted outer membrane repeat protein
LKWRNNQYFEEEINGEKRASNFLYSSSTEVSSQIRCIINMKNSCEDEMKMKRQLFFVLAVAFLLPHSLPISFGDGAGFQGLGHPSGSTFSIANDVSADGTVVVGWSSFASDNREAFRWTSSGGLKGLGDLPGGNYYDFFSMANGVSGDGSVVVGLSEGASGYEAFRWTESGGMVGMGTLGGANFFSQAEAISYDGTVIVGHSDGVFGREAFRWTESIGMRGIGDLPGGSFNSKARDVSLNGRVIVGEGRTDSGTEPFLRRASGNLISLGLLPGADYGWAEAASMDGSIVVGICNFESDVQAFLWTESEGMQSLGSGTTAYDVSADGSVIVGSSSSFNASIWDEQNGMRSIRDLLEDDYGLNLNGWYLSVATAISPDGLTIVGYGTNPQGNVEGWIAKLPKPAPIKVDADAQGAKNGSSWANAYNHLQDALAVARYGNEIRVAQGIYTPDSNSSDPNGSGDREATFRLINGVTVKGGYAGFGEPDPDARDIRLYETILSGDLGSNDEPGLVPCDLINHPSRAENSYHVVTGNGVDTAAVLDGFTINAGNANGPVSPKTTGGGMLCNCTATVSNCTFTVNSAVLGGGICCTYVLYETRPTLINCMFIGNSASESGGGVRAYGSNPTLINCKISGNLAGKLGGGLMPGSENDIKLVNCLINGNSASQAGGGIYAGFYFDLTMINCTLSGNSAGNLGGAIYTGAQYSTTTTTMTNCILWANTPEEIYAVEPPVLTYSDIQGGYPGEGNIDADPCFADANNGDYHLKSEAGRWDANSQTWIKDDVNSPCIDAGDPNSDWTGEFWPHGKRINMGIYGGTPEASMSLSDAGNIADLNLDGLFCYRDIKLLTDKWLCETLLLPEDLSRDGIVNFTDFAIFAHDFELPARNPNPADGATGVNITSDLNWTAGRGATSHDVYFGTSNPPPFIHNQVAATFDPGTMAYINKYYWRIDEVNKWGTTAGTVWSFTTIMFPPPPLP